MIYDWIRNFYLNWLNHVTDNQYDNPHTHVNMLTLSLSFYLIAVTHANDSLSTIMCQSTWNYSHTHTHNVNLIHSVESTNWIINEVQALTFPMSMVEATWIILIHCGLYWRMNRQVVSLQHTTAHSTMSWTHHTAINLPPSISFSRSLCI